MTAAIKVENLSKSYLVGHKDAERARYTALRDVLARGAKSLVQKTADVLRGRQLVAGDTVEEFWALKDINFEVQQGEVLGIIGRNGAGKSTLLKLLSRITEPSTGRIVLNGRVASLLEVGTGFHPELTGRENIFLNGAILGMARSEIRKRFDEIVAFAEVEKFLDTPVKYYSSGMYVRLAFGVAAHLESEILIVDEVLAVGDAEFQKKCLGKMDSVAKGGKTIIFVSHDMRSIMSLCDRGILLTAGRIEKDGAMTGVAQAYLAHNANRSDFADLSDRPDRSGSGEILLQFIELLCGGEQRKTFAFGEPFTLRIGAKVFKGIGAATLMAFVYSSDGVLIYSFANKDGNIEWSSEDGDVEFTITVGQLRLYPGSYWINLWVGDRNTHRIDYISEATRFDVIQDKNSGMARTLDRGEGLIYQDAVWRCEKK